MKLIKHYLPFLLLLTGLCLSACSGGSTNPANNQSSGSPAATSGAATASNKSPRIPNVIFTASPNPIKICDGSQYGVTNVTHEAPGVSTVEVRVGQVDGGLLAHTIGAKITSTTGKWVHDGLVLYLQDVSDGKTLTPENTLATLTLRVTTEGCP